MTQAGKDLPSVFQYNNYREFLKDTYAFMKAKDKKFSFRYFARVAGFNSHNFLRLVMHGQSNLSPESIEKITKALKLNREEAHYFENLVLLNQATTSEEKQTFARELLRSRSFKKIHPLSESKFQFFSNWYVSAVRELIALPGAKDDPEWLAAHIYPPIRPQDAKKAIDELLKLGMLKQNESGKLIQSEPVLSTPDEVSSTYVSNWHKEYIRKGSDSIDSIPREKRDISAVSFGFSKKNIKLIKEMISEFRKELIRVASEQDQKDILMQFNMQLFPLAEVETEGEE